MGLFLEGTGNRIVEEHQERISHSNAQGGGEMEAGILSWRDSLCKDPQSGTQG